MKDCQKIKKDLVAFLYGELGPEEEAHITTHLDICPRCQDEWRGISLINRESDPLSKEISEAMSRIDWKALPEKIADKVFKEEKTPRASWTKTFWNVVFQPSLRLVYAGLLLGLIIGSLATYLVFWSPQLQVAKGPDFVFTKEFLDKAELEVARRETLEYLEKSQYLLLDFIQSPSGEPSDLWKDEFALQRARDLLSKKKFINPQLEKFRMAKAKEICDQIEFLFYELTQLSEHLSAEDIQRIQYLIEEKQLMLKIKLVKNELKKNEV